MTGSILTFPIYTNLRQFGSIIAANLRPDTDRRVRRPTRAPLTPAASPEPPPSTLRQPPRRAPRREARHRRHPASSRFRATHPRRRPPRPSHRKKCRRLEYVAGSRRILSIPTPNASPAVTSQLALFNPGNLHKVALQSDFQRCISMDGDRDTCGIQPSHSDFHYLVRIGQVDILHVNR